MRIPTSSRLDRGRLPCEIIGIVGNVKHIGLWGPRIRKAYTDMGVLQLGDVDAEQMQREDEAVAERFDRELGITSEALQA